MEETKKRKRKSPTPKKADYYFRCTHEVKLRDPNTGAYIRDKWGRIKTEVKFKPPQPGFYNRNIDCYDIMVDGEYFSTLHAKMGMGMEDVWVEALKKNKRLLDIPKGKVEIKFIQTVL